MVAHCLICCAEHMSVWTEGKQTSTNSKFLRDVNAASLSDIALLQHEKEMHEMWVRYAAKSTTGATFGMLAAWASFGVSMVLSGPIVGRNIYWANYYSKKCAICSEEVRRRGLQSLDTSYAKLTAYCLTTLTIGGVCAAIPFMDGMEESASRLIDFVVEPCSAAAKAAVNQLDQIFDGVDEAEQIVAESSTSDIVEILDGQPNGLLCGNLSSQCGQKEHRKHKG